MRLSTPFLTTVGVLLIAFAPGCAQRADQPSATDPAASGCGGSAAGLVLPDSFCAVLLAEANAPRHLVVAANGDLYAATGDGVAAYRDTTGDGRPDRQATFGPGGGNDVALHEGYLYYALPDRIVRWKRDSAQLVPAGEPETVVSGLPAGAAHPMKSVAFAGDSMFVSFGSATNTCQESNGRPRSPGESPCGELQTRAGIWVFPAGQTGLTVAAGTRYATGLRNAEALAVDPATGQLWMGMNGRDQLKDWGFGDTVNANNPAEEFGPVSRGADYGWPYCYYSNEVNRKVLAPEYGGNGTTVGRCASAASPAVAFPGHWAPLALAFYDADRFGPQYRRGVFIAFHGSWNRAPLPQEGYRVVFVPFANGRPSGDYQTFATGANGPRSLRASGVAVGPDGGLYIAADVQGKIWKVLPAAAAP